MQIIIRTLVIIATLVILAKKSGIIGDSSLSSPCPSHTYLFEEASHTKPANDIRLNEKDILGTSLNDFIHSNLQRYIRKQGDTAYFSIYGKSHTIITRTNTHHYDRNKPVRMFYQIRPVIISTYFDEYEALQISDGVDLVAYIHILSDEYKMKEEGLFHRDTWSPGRPDLPVFRVARKKGGEFQWMISPKHNFENTITPG